MSDAALSAPATQRFSTGEAIKHVVLILGALVVLLPFYVMISYSFKAPAELMQNTGGFFGTQEPFLDERCLYLTGGDEEGCMVNPTVYNYSSAFREAPLIRYLLNGVIVTVSIFLIQVIVALPCAYALAKLKFWGRDAVFGIVLFCC